MCRRERGSEGREREVGRGREGREGKRERTGKSDIPQYFSTVH